jgi:hypothetical protein
VNAGSTIALLEYAAIVVAMIAVGVLAFVLIISERAGLDHLEPNSPPSGGSYGSARSEERLEEMTAKLEDAAETLRDLVDQLEQAVKRD